MDSQQMMQSRTLKLVGALGAALATSTLTTLGVLYFVSRRRHATVERISQERADAPPAQPAVSTSMPAEPPKHFSEDLLVPGLTYTGPEVVEQDNNTGRSPEGV